VELLRLLPSNILLLRVAQVPAGEPVLLAQMAAAVRVGIEQQQVFQ
jgi:hypothetical protein